MPVTPVPTRAAGANSGGNKSKNEISANDALGIWCRSADLAPGDSITAWATLQDNAVGPVRYNPYSLHTDPVTGSPFFAVVADNESAAPGPTFGGVSFSDALPASLTLVGVTTTAGSCTGGQTVSCALGDLANGAHAIIAITVQAPGTSQAIANTASTSLTGPQSETNPGNDSVTSTVTAR